MRHFVLFLTVDRKLRWHLSVIACLLLSLFISPAAAQQTTGATSTVSIVWQQWLTPQTIFSAILLFIYFGEMRADFKALKAKIAALDLWREGLDDHLNQRFMPREVVDRRFLNLERERHERGDR